MNKKRENTMSDRQPWYVPAIIFGGLEFCIPVLMLGGILATNFSLLNVIAILVVGLVIIQWIGNTIVGYIGAKTGLNASDLASISLGKKQSKLIVSSTILFITLGWWAIQTAVATDALSSLLSISKASNFITYCSITTVIGVLFALPSIIGFSSMKWVDYIAIPAGIILVVVAIYLSLENIGIEKILSWDPPSDMSFLEAVNLVIGINVVQWLFAADYTRLARPVWRDHILIPLGIVAIGFPLFIVGAIMSIGIGSSDIITIMENLGFPSWGFIVLWLATWTSQMVNNYSGGLVVGSILNKGGEKARKRSTLLFSLIGIVIAIAGIMDYFIHFLNLLSLLVPAIVGVIVVHHFKNKEYVMLKNNHWNVHATIAIAVGVLIGYITQYQYHFGIPALQSLFVSSVFYFVLSQFSKKYI